MSSPNDALTALLAALPTHPDVNVVVTQATARVTIKGSVSATYDLLPDGTLVALGAPVTSDQVVAGWPVPSLPPPPPPVVTLTAPAHLVAVPGDAKMTLTWDPVPNATGYHLQLGTTSGAYLGGYDVQGTSGVFDNPPLVNGTAYYFVVNATAGGVSGPMSLEVSATPVGIPLPPPVGTKGMRVGVNAGWEIDWHDIGDTFVPGVDFTKTTNPFQPKLISDLAQFTGAIRLMDMTATNTEKVTNWATRTKKTDPVAKQSSESGGLAWEWAILLANFTGRDLWVNIPYQSQIGRNANDYALNLAQLIKDLLDPKRRVYVEWSNEAWNGQFPTLNYALAQGQALNLDTDKYSNAFKFTAVASAKCFDAFDTVWGKGNARVVKVMPGQRGTPWLVGVHLDQLKKEGQDCDAYAIAPYFRGTTVAAQMSSMNSMMASDVLPVAKVVKAAGKRFFYYEGGNEEYDAAIPVNRDQGMEGVYTSFLDQSLAAGVEEANLYLLQAPASMGGAWGLEEKLGQDLATAPKMRSVVNWIKAHPLT